jgi:nitrogenase molybdenum-cofactor synthesis protein NifE
MVALVREIHKSLNNPIWEQVRRPAPWEQGGDTRCKTQDSSTAVTLSGNDASPLNLAA